ELSHPLFLVRSQCLAQDLLERFDGGCLRPQPLGLIGFPSGSNLLRLLRVELQRLIKSSGRATPREQSERGAERQERRGGRRGGSRSRKGEVALERRTEHPGDGGLLL